MSAIDLGSARFRAADDCADVSVRDTLAEAIRRIDSGQWKAGSIILLGLETFDNGGTVMEVMHGGPANTNERLGMYVRATKLALDNMCGDSD